MTKIGFLIEDKLAKQPKFKKSDEQLKDQLKRLEQLTIDTRLSNRVQILLKNMLADR